MIPKNETKVAFEINHLRCATYSWMQTTRVRLRIRDGGKERNNASDGIKDGGLANDTDGDLADSG
jgi:hypothetical protein